MTSGTVQEALAALDPFLSNGGDLTLSCADGHKLTVLSQLLGVASPLLADLLTCKPVELQVHEDSVDAWRAALLFLYPVFPRPAMTLALAHTLLPVAHKYDMGGLLGEALGFVVERSPSLTLSDQPPETSLLAWCQLAECLHLPPLLEACLARAASFSVSQLTPLLLSAYQAGTPQLWRTVATAIQSGISGFGAWGGYLTFLLQLLHTVETAQQVTAAATASSLEVGTATTGTEQQQGSTAGGNATTEAGVAAGGQTDRVTTVTAVSAAEAVECSDSERLVQLHAACMAELSVACNEALAASEHLPPPFVQLQPATQVALFCTWFVHAGREAKKQRAEVASLQAARGSLQAQLASTKAALVQAQHAAGSGGGSGGSRGGASSKAQVPRAAGGQAGK
eukprot:CAMPEP_0202868636 /NCGR_PEP_ID=MMETSP1391-20130828/10984_1 /ASSEMBLY_ACC=CAM_ASM_000867 /TAXON_ID=1034604 /ORGANISM="Chlamydomonas leiostraca, Strain SAG 11-49" /LENGTH=395 /DNA_ID=CAMNT_0049548823 /DNA_START=30 /DNA_END=1217 /DNA_ORIENTATION=+